jgi:cell wall-associated NlpC family hydrolase
MLSALLVVLLGSGSAPTDPLLRAHVVAAAYEFLGRPYGAPQQHGPDLDCSGFVREVYGRFGVHLAAVSREQAKQGRAIPFDSLGLGDLVFFSSRTSGPGRVGHVGLVADIDGSGRVWMLHSSVRGIRLDTVSNRGRYLCARRVVELAPATGDTTESDLEGAITPP